MSNLFRSRAFLTAIMDAVVLSLTFLAARFLSPADVDLVKFLIAAWQPVVIIVIAKWGYEDGVALRAGISRTVSGSVGEPGPVRLRS